MRVKGCACAIAGRRRAAGQGGLETLDACQRICLWERFGVGLLVDPERAARRLFPVMGLKPLLKLVRGHDIVPVVAQDVGFKLCAGCLVGLRQVVVELDHRPL